MNKDNTEVITTSGRKMYTYCENECKAKEKWLNQWLYLGENYYKEKIIKVNFLENGDE